MHDVKYLSSSFDGDVIFVLSPLPLGAPSLSSQGMNGMDKVYDGHAKSTNFLYSTLV